MSGRRPASGSPFPSAYKNLLLLSLGLCLALPRPALGQVEGGSGPGEVDLWLPSGDAPPDGPMGRELAARLGLRPQPGDPLDWAARARPGFGRERLAELQRIEALLSLARRQAAGLQEQQALTTLAEAEGIATAVLDLPGAAAWNAEVQLWIGLTAAQAGLDPLAEAALQRAASMGPERRVRAAEAPPALVQRAERIRLSLVTGATGSFQVRAQPSGAMVYLDDEEQGRSPLELEATVGRHLLRVEAPGHQPYGVLLQVLEGPRSAVVVQLSPNPTRVAMERLLAAARAADPEAAPEALASLARLGLPVGTAVIVESDPASGRALVHRCSAAGCVQPQRVVAGEPQALQAEPLEPGQLPLQRAWLHDGNRSQEAVSEADPPGWKRWLVWGGVIAAVAASSLAIAVAAQPDAAPEVLEIVIDPNQIRE